MSLKALKEEMVAFMVENPPADTSVRFVLCLKRTRLGTCSVANNSLLLCCHAYYLLFLHRRTSRTRRMRVFAR